MLAQTMLPQTLGSTLSLLMGRRAPSRRCLIGPRTPCPPSRPGPS